jgi:flagellar biosynthetic protein FlhB
MAEEQDNSEKTEDPTRKRLDDAIERGDVVKSQEVSTWFVLAGAALVMVAFSASTARSLQTMLAGFLANAHRLRVDGPGLVDLTGRIGGELLAALAVPFLLLLLAALGGNLIQHRLVFSAQALVPRLDKISPVAGLKRLFSKQALVNFAKGVFKIALFGALMVFLLWPQREVLPLLVGEDVVAILPFARALILKLLGATIALLAIIAAADYLFQYRVWFERQKMSLREMKEEFKQTEGDPAIKARIRRIRETRARKRMMAAVPKATVVIANPTHFAVALKYERGDNAPVCVAKGVDAVALKIREVAEQNAVPVVENPPLARALHATVELDQEIPAEHYKAVAEVIGFVMRLRGALRR